MNDVNKGKVKMIYTYFTISASRSFDGKRVMVYKSKSTKVGYHYEVSEASIEEFRSKNINKEVEKLMKSLICVIRDERISRLRRN